MALSTQTQTLQDRVLSILADIAGTDQVRQDLDLALFEQHILDSLGMMELIVALSAECNIEIAPAEIERAHWDTPRKIIAQIEQRVGKG